MSQDSLLCPNLFTQVFNICSHGDDDDEEAAAPGWNQAVWTQTRWTFLHFPFLRLLFFLSGAAEKVEEALLDDAEIQILISCKVMKQQFYSLAFVESVLKAQSDHAILYKLDNHRPVLLTHLLKIFI